MVEGLQAFAAGEGHPQVEAEAVDAEFQRPAAHRFEDEPSAEGGVGGDGVAAARHIEVVPPGILQVVGLVGEASPTEGGPLGAAFGGVVVDHVHQHLKVGVVAGGHEGSQFMAQGQWIGVGGIAAVGGEPAEGAVTPVVAAAGRGVVGIEGHRGQQLDGGDAQLPQVGQQRDQPQETALQLRCHRTGGPTAEAPRVQFVDDRLGPGVPGAGVPNKIERLPFGDHPLETAVGVGLVPQAPQPVVDPPAADGAGAGVEQHLGGLKAVATGGQRPEDAVAVAATQFKALHLGVPVVAAAVQMRIQPQHTARFAGVPVGEDQQLEGRRQGGRHREVDPRGGATAAERPRSADAQNHGGRSPRFSDRNQGMG